ncbi:MAG: DNA repair protein RecN [Deltaproteobacteria bacterium]|jgi:DNA repair protein RecN (Recombination protein N)|nr:DNA repair protein RecN [Deltaproteobacteria bacterium]
MLREFSIRNFAIIDDLQISFSEGLAILSGETGAGKSIIINAVNLLLGSRATAKLIRTGYETAELEALFQIKKQSPIAKIMKDNGYNPEEGLLIRRIISRKDRHRIYINGRLTTIGILNLITENLASISGQHAHQGLLKEDQQLAIIDQFGGLTAVREKVSRCFHEIVPLIRRLNDLKHKRDRQAEHIQLLEFQQKEIRQASVSPGEDTALEQERTRLKNSEALFQTVQGGIEMLYDSHGAAVEVLLVVKKDLDKASTIDPLLAPKAERIAEAAFHLEDIADELRTYLKNIQTDESRLDTVEERLDTLVKLKRKYGGSLETVLLRLESIDHEFSEVENLSGNIADTEKKLFELHGKLTELTHKLSRDRKKTAKTLAQKVEKELTSLKMPHTKFKISFRTMPADEDVDPYLTIEEKTVFETGIDQATFRIAPNVGEPLKPLPSIVSGGELSRVVLALKAILAETEAVETIVFDEVDAGIGGSVAEVVGKKLSSLARHHQVICITHLPQIAKFGDHHFRISKRVSDGRTSTIIKRLSETERVKEIARMLGGEKITRATLDHAHEMLGKIRTP